MALLRRRRKKKDAERQEDAFKNAQDDERKRQNQVRREEMQRDVMQTAEGGGIMEGANISLGFDDEDEDDLFDSMTGLIV